jgi:formylglycine-generating enzyme required for sulfatase activity
MGRSLITLASVCFLSFVAWGQDTQPDSDGPVFQDCADCPTMVTLPTGRFIMGANDQRETYGPAHDQVMPKRIAIARTETTFAQYDVCVDEGECAGGTSDHGWGRGKQPVINVSWQDAVDYAEWLSRRTGFTYRLPTEIEWEYAARSGTVTRYPWGEMAGVGNANCRRCGTEWSGLGTAPVAQFPSNAFGLHDMNGNVSEWVADCWADRHDVGGKNANGPDVCPARVTRGGDWYYVPILSTSAARKPNAPNLWSYTIGFRVVRDFAAETTAP